MLHEKNLFSFLNSVYKGKHFSIISIMKKIITHIITVFVFIFIILTVIGNYFYNIAINRRTASNLLMGHYNLKDDGGERRVMRADTDTDIVSDEGFAAEAILNARANPSEWQVTSFDGMTLKGSCYLRPDGSDRWIVAVHGYRGDRRQVISPALVFFDRGYNILAVDCRGHGESEGDYIGMGWHDRIDLLTWAREIIGLYPHAEIVLYGISMGGSAVLMASGESVPSNIRAVIADCAYTDVYSQFTYQMNTFFHLPDFPFISAASLVCAVRANYMFEEASALDQVKNSKLPTLFIHGSDDEIIPVSMAYELFEAFGGEQNDLLVVRGAEHGVSYNAEPELYWGRIFEFLEGVN